MSPRATRVRLVSPGPGPSRAARTGAALTVYTQDDPAFPEGMAGVVDDRALETSYKLKIEIVPTLIRFDGGKEANRVIGWNRAEWQALTGINRLGKDLPENRPGCGRVSHRRAPQSGQPLK